MTMPQILIKSSKSTDVILGLKTAKSVFCHSSSRPAVWQDCR